MFSHVMVGSNDVDGRRNSTTRCSRRRRKSTTRGVSPIAAAARCSWSRKPIDGQPARHANGGTIGFNFDSPEEVDAWHRRGIEAGGTPIEDPPGYRENAFGKLYLAYLRDPDGNKLCGLHRPEQ